MRLGPIEFKKSALGATNFNGRTLVCIHYGKNWFVISRNWSNKGLIVQLWPPKIEYTPLGVSATSFVVKNRDTGVRHSFRDLEEMERWIKEHERITGEIVAKPHYFERAIAAISEQDGHKP